MVVELSRDPGGGYLRAAAGLLPGRRRSGALPGRELVRRRVPVDRAHLAAYDRVCGFRLTDTLPATYPHVLAFPLQMALMTSPDFPFPAIGSAFINASNFACVLPSKGSLCVPLPATPSVRYATKTFIR